jgi:hypothetical protein
MRLRSAREGNYPCRHPAGKGREGIKYKQELLLALLHILANTLQFATEPNDLEAKIEASRTIINLYKTIFRGDYGGHAGRMALLYNCYAQALRETKPDEAIDAYAQALEYAKTNDESFDVEKGEVAYTSPYLNRMTYNLENFVRGDVVLLLDEMKREKNKNLLKNAKFAELVKEAEAWVTERG